MHEHKGVCSESRGGAPATLLYSFPCPVRGSLVTSISWINHSLHSAAGRPQGRFGGYLYCSGLISGKPLEVSLRASPSPRPRSHPPDSGACGWPRPQPESTGSLPWEALECHSNTARESAGAASSPAHPTSELLVLSVSEGTQGFLCDAPRLLPVADPANRGECVTLGAFQEEVMQARVPWEGQWIIRMLGWILGSRTVPGQRPLIPQSRIQAGRCAQSPCASPEPPGCLRRS